MTYRDTEYQKSNPLYFDSLKLLKRQLDLRFNFSKDRLKENTTLTPLIPILTSGLGNTQITFNNDFPSRPLKSNSANVFDSNHEFKYQGLYRKIAQTLALESVDERGILRNRMQKLNFRIRDEQADTKLMDSRGKSFMSYIENDVSHGVLVVVGAVPIIDMPIYYLGLFVKRIKYRLNTFFSATLLDKKS